MEEALLRTIRIGMLLLQLGVPPEKIKAELVRAFGFPEDFNEAMPAPMPAPAEAAPPALAALPGLPPEGVM